MARIRTILQGFVDLNLELDENINTKIQTNTNTFQSGNIQDAGLTTSPLFATRSVSEITLPNSVEEIASDINVEFATIRLAHIQGSRLYGVASQESDWDLSIITTEADSYRFAETSIDGVEYDIHLYSPERFQELIDNHNMRELEVIFHPEEVRLIDELSFTTEVDKQKLINTVRNESDDLWERARNIINDDTQDNYRGLKNVWHSFRFLIFAEQILKDGAITNYSAANYLHGEIVNSQQTDFQYFEDNYGNMREQMKSDLDQYLDDPGFTVIDTIIGLPR